MTYQMFKEQNDINKKYVSNIGRITDIDWNTNTCVLNVFTRKTKMNIADLVHEIAIDGLGAITNAYLLKKWPGFEK